MTGAVTTVAGSLSGTVGLDNQGHADGLGTAASFYLPLGVAMDDGASVLIIVSCRRMRVARLSGAGEEVCMPGGLATLAAVPRNLRSGLPLFAAPPPTPTPNPTSYLRVIRTTTWYALSTWRAESLLPLLVTFLALSAQIISAIKTDMVRLLRSINLLASL